MSCIFDVIVKDIVEIVIIYTKSISVLNEIIKLYERFDDKNIISRIKDKLTIRKRDRFGDYYYYLHEKCHREYDRPVCIDFDYEIGMIDIQWKIDGVYARSSDLPDFVSQDGFRAWEKRKYYPTAIYFIYRGSYSAYLFNNVQIDFDGFRYVYGIGSINILAN